MKFTICMIALSTFFVANASANNFSCSFGKQGACLDYNDKICSSYSKCVSQNAICFQPNTCGYDGFICKSEYTSLSNEYDGLLGKCRGIASDYDNISVEYDELVDKYNRLLRNYQNVEICIEYASSIEEAKLCM